MDGSAPKSKLLEAKQRRKDVSSDATLLQNRIALLKAEEARAWKKIEQTKKRAMELVKLRQEKENYARERTALMTNAERELQAQQQMKRELVLASEKKEIDQQILEQKRSDAQQLKEDKQKWRQFTENKKRLELEEAVRRREDVLKQENQLKRARQVKQMEVERANKERADSIIRREEQACLDKEQEVQEMERLEMELIQRLRNTQHLQKQAYEELEQALSGGSTSIMPQASVSTRSQV
ncbi:hypothetical protein H310_02578 [Aphanomyces invadans]|uniref:Uncharacterized protein n=1 Tax=Aphanomyces invadans TaxID=157072 RepID=A0A024UJB3_9STRA|nr:hypothetical protein H310_02578 [Aphanomyces invadans]ETW06285.1 hypothetical protein H310_02578 [Aphanomyces invadans]|eukprot:XP_008864360.1 hypothetical protein H310_02578 [Aphanomyces invadans]